MYFENLKHYKKSSIIFLICAMLPQMAYSQSNYNDYSKNDREDLFYENFQSSYNVNDITYDKDGNSYGEYHTGYFELKCTKSTGIGCTNQIVSTLDQTRDFEIEASIMFKDGLDNNGNGITWGRLDDSNRFNFSFSGNGQFSVYKRKENIWSEIKGWTISSAINKAGYNKLTIRKVDNNYYFFINEINVCGCPFVPFFGNTMYLFANTNSTVRINSIRVSHLNEKNGSTSFQNNLPPILSIQDISFSKNQLNANETAQLEITLKNIGAGDANGVSVNLSSDLMGLAFATKTNVPVIAKNGGTQTVKIDIKGGLDLPTAEAVLKIEVIEPNFKVKIQGKQARFPTKEFLKPELVLAKFAVVEDLSANPNSQIDINEQVDVKFAIQNIGQGSAENINISLINNQTGVMLLGVVDNAGNLIRKNPFLPNLASGKFESITYRYFINSEFASNQLTFNITFTEKHGKYGVSQSKSVEINKVLQEEGYIRTVAQINDNLNHQKVVIEDIPDFVSDVDQNIPVNTIVNDKTFAVIIGNEVYSKEIKVKFALNDARVFKQYALKTLGIPSKNITYIENATFGQMLDALKWINDVIKAYKGQAKVIFYYAGHGMPDEQTRSSYLLPVDGNAQNAATAVKLADVYSKLTEYSSVSLNVFLDACFSGSARDQNSMLAEGRGVKLTPNSDLLTGNLVVLSASSGNETAYPYSEKQHGLFTYYLLKKLKDSKGNSTLRELSDYIITNVTQQSVVINKKPQTPQVNYSTEIQNKWQSIMLK